MGAVCIVGLPTQLLKRFKAAAAARQLEVDCILVALGESGYFRFTPEPDQAVEFLRGYADDLPSYDDARIVVMPYAPLPDALKDDLAFFEGDVEGASVVRIKQGVEGWPKATVGEFDISFFASVLQALAAQLFPGAPPPKATLPSERFRELARNNAKILIPPAVLADCDSVLPSRYKFMLAAADAFEKFIVEGTDGKTAEEFFRALKLKHAQSGGIVAEINVVRKGTSEHRGSTQLHLKQGDGTTANGAARIYYYEFELGKATYLAILYAGPHPHANVQRIYSLGD